MPSKRTFNEIKKIKKKIVKEGSEALGMAKIKQT